MKPNDQPQSRPTQAAVSWSIALYEGRSGRGTAEVGNNGKGIMLGSGKKGSLRRVGADCWLTLTIHEGRKRQVRRMLAEVGHPVLELVRVGIGPLRLGDVELGRWRYLTDEEINALYPGYG